MSVRSVVDRVRRRVGRGGVAAVGPGVVDGPLDIGAVAAVVDAMDASVGVGVRQRAAEVIGALSPDQPCAVGGDTRVVLEVLVGALDPFDGSRAWLLLAALNGRLPEGGEVRAVVRTAELDGLETAVAAAIIRRLTGTPEISANWAPVKVLTGQCLVDVHHTAGTDFATGIQRVTREVTRRWVEWHGPTLIGWRSDLTAMRALSPAEAHRACWGGPAVEIPADDSTIIPWRCTYLLPELAADVPRTKRLQKMAQYSSTLNIIGYDLVPLTSAETTNDLVVPGFVGNLAAARYARNIVPISEAAADEYRGWRDMLTGTGLVGPRIDAIALPSGVPPDEPDATAFARRRLRIGSMPLVLVVGSHEPRKNHLAVLHAAELLWREGVLFSLTFIGGNAWKSETFTSTLIGLQDAGRPVEAISAASDRLLWGGYRSARFTVFPSLNEGFGLPVAESLACGTPVVTSAFGSMKEIVEAGGGAMLVDPRDDRSLADAMRRLITDDRLHAELVEQARTRPSRTWDDYARATWAMLNRGVRSSE